MCIIENLVISAVLSIVYNTVQYCIQCGTVSMCTVYMNQLLDYRTILHVVSERTLHKPLQDFKIKSKTLKVYLNE